MPEQIYDYVIAPDAKEFPIEDGYRSAKSTSPEKWNEVVSLLPENLTICIIKGVTHSEYTLAVYKACLQTARKVTFVETQTLDDFCTTVEKGKHFIGMDSGPTRLANEVALMTQKHGHQIKVLQLLNGTVSIPNEFAIRGNDNIATLVWNDPTVELIPTDKEADNLHDLNRVPASTITKAILNQYIW